MKLQTTYYFLENINSYMKPNSLLLYKENRNVTRQTLVSHKIWNTCWSADDKICKPAMICKYPQPLKSQDKYSKITR